MLQNPVKVCGGCLRRAYCSEQCQQDDWSVTGTLQRHANWCVKYECGEEGIDWEVVPVPGKGMGVRAKKKLAAGFRIIVDPVYTDPKHHPGRFVSHSLKITTGNIAEPYFIGIMDLAPEGAPLDVKFQVNSLNGDPSRDGGRSYVGLRVSRVNHDCRPNAGYVYDEIARVEIVFAQREIQPGEEVCISYCSFASLNLERPTAVLSTETEFQFIQKTLLTTWGIVCPTDCFCKDPAARELVLEGRRINNEMDVLAGKGWLEEALLKGEKLTEIQRRLNVSWLCRAGTHFYCFQIAVRSRKTLGRASKYMEQVLESYRVICPYSEYTSKYERMLKYPETDGNYLSMDRCR